MLIGRATFVAILGMLLFLLAKVIVIAFASIEVTRSIRNVSTVQLPAIGIGAGAWP